MKRQLIIWTVFLLVTNSFTSCNGQGNPTLPKDNVSEPKAITEGQTKLIKTQGTNEYANVHCGLQDKSGNLWFGTTGEGVYRYDGKLFTQFTVKDGLSNNNVWSVAEDDVGNIWFGTGNGISLYDGKAISEIPIPRSIERNSNNLLDNTSAKNAVWSILQDKAGKLWFGTDNGVYCYNGKSFTNFLETDSVINNQRLQLKMIQCILEDKNGNIWFGSGLGQLEGICRYDGKELTNFKPDGEDWFRNIIETQDGAILFCGRHQGVYRYDGRTFTKFPTPSEMEKSSLINVMEDKAGNIWYASDYGHDINDTLGGVWRYDGKTFTKYSKKSGLLNTSAYFMLEDKVGNIWIGTRNTALFCYNGKSFTGFSE